MLGKFKFSLGGAGSPSTLKQGFLKAASGSVMLKIFSASAQITATIILAKILGAGGYGAYVYILSLIALIGIPFKMGLPNLVARNTAVYFTQTNWSAMRGLLRRGVQLVFILSLVLAILAAGIATFMFSSQSAYYTFLIALGILPCIALSGIRRGALIGLHRPVLAQMPEQIIQPALFVALVVLSLVLIDKANFNPTVAMTLRVATVVVELVIGYILLSRHLPKEVNENKPSFETSGWLRGAVAFSLIGGMATINTEIGILLLGVFANIEDVGVYKGVIVLSALVTFVLTSFNTALLPLAAKLHTENKKEELQRLLTLSCRLVVLCGLPATLILVFFGKQCLFWLYGEEFTRGSTALAVLSVGMFLNAATGPVGMLLNTTGYEMDTIKGRLVGTALNIILGIILIPKMGLEGAAWAAAISLLTWNLILVVIVRKRLNLNSTIFGSILHK